MKKFFIVILSLIIGCFAVGCGTNGGRPAGNKVDKTKTQLSIANFDGGVGRQWLEVLGKEFEEKYAEVSFEKGKKGVQIMPVNNMMNYQATINSTSFDVFFAEAVSYFDLVSSGKILDITDIVRENIEEENKTIESKLSPVQKDALTALDGKYYALPHYEVFGGMVYDVDVFEDSKLYFAKDKNNGNNGFIVTPNDERSAGPDGKTGTFDDGLPATYDEFFALCDYMVDKGVIPFTYAGKQGDYMNFLLNALMGQYNGYNETYMNVGFDGTSHIITGFDGTSPIIEEKKITRENGYLLSQQAGKYYALNFVERLLANESYRHDLALSGTQSHTDAQDNIINGFLEQAPVGMLIDGNYWYNEAVKTGIVERSIASYGDDARNRRFGWMPLPTRNAVGQGHSDELVLIDEADSYCFINSNIKNNPVKVELAKAFVKFCYTDNALRTFTKASGCTKAINYTLTDEDKGELSYFVNNFIEQRESAKIVYPTASNKLFINKQLAFSFNIGQNMWKSSIDGNDYRQPINALKPSIGINSKDYFNGMAVTETSWKNAYSSYLD